MEDFILELDKKGIITNIVDLTNGKFKVSLYFSKNNSLIDSAIGNTPDEAMCSIVFKLSDGGCKTKDMLSYL